LLPHVVTLSPEKQIVFVSVYILAIVFCGIFSENIWVTEVRVSARRHLSQKNGKWLYNVYLTIRKTGEKAGAALKFQQRFERANLRRPRVAKS